MTNKEGKEALTAARSNKIRDEIIQIMEDFGHTQSGAVYSLLHYFEDELVPEKLSEVAEKDKEIEELKVVNAQLKHLAIQNRNEILSLKNVSEVAESRKANGDLQLALTLMTNPGTNDTFNKCREMFLADKAGYLKIDTQNPHDYAFAAGYYHSMLTALFNGSGEIVPPEKEWEETRDENIGDIIMISLMNDQETAFEVIKRQFDIKLKLPKY